MTTLLGLSGSLRKASTNTMLMRNAAEIFGPDTFVEGDIRFPEGFSMRAAAQRWRSFGVGLR